MNELIAALVGAIVGAGLAVGVAYFQRQWARADRVIAERDQARLVLVREIVRYRLDQARLIGPLNEVPLVFGHDPDALRLYRETLAATESDVRTRALADLVNCLAKLVELPDSVQVSDLQRGFTLAE